MTDSSDSQYIRVSKLLSERGICSRREADRYIEKGLVRVNGTLATLGQKALRTDKIEFKPAVTSEQNQKITLALHKPLGYVSGPADGDYPSALDLIRSENLWEKCFSGSPTTPEGPSKPSIQRDGLAPLGRLDVNSTGLLILSNDGVLAKKIIGPDSNLEKEYIVKVAGHPAPAQLEKLRHGLSLNERPEKLSRNTRNNSHRRNHARVLKPAIVEILNSEASDSDNSRLVVDEKPITSASSGSLPTTVTNLKFVLTEGAYRQIRRMCDQVDLEVISLKRVRMGQFELGALPYGQFIPIVSQHVAD